MAKVDKKYHKLLETILKDGFKYEDPNRKGINRIQIPSYQFKHDFKDGFPAITTKKLYWEGVVGEFLWILRGSDNIKYLIDNDINIWNKDAYNYYLKQGNEAGYKPNDTVMLSFTEWLQEIKEGEDLLGDIGRGYGAQLRNWKINNDYSVFGKMNMVTLDQFAELINTLKTNPMATKKTVTFWNPAEKNQCALTPCHWSFEILVEPLSDKVISDNALKLAIHTSKNKRRSADITWAFTQTPKYQFTLKWHQHSVDVFLGLNFNISSYALLAQIIGKMTNMIPKGIIGDLSNVHIYEPHVDAVKEQLSRDVNKYGKCELSIDYDIEMGLKMPSLLEAFDKTLSQIEIKDFTLDGYNSYPTIPAEMLAYSK